MITMKNKKEDRDSANPKSSKPIYKQEWAIRMSVFVEKPEQFSSFSD